MVSMATIIVTISPKLDLHIKNTHEPPLPPRMFQNLSGPWTDYYALIKSMSSEDVAQQPVPQNMELPVPVE